MDSLERRFVRSRLLRIYGRNFRRQLRQERGQLVVVFVVVLALVLLAWFRFQNLGAAILILLGYGLGELVKLIRESVFQPLGKWVTVLFQEGDYGKQSVIWRNS
jgi:hypothetical protein